MGTLKRPIGLSRGAAVLQRGKGSGPTVLGGFFGSNCACCRKRIGRLRAVGPGNQHHRPKPNQNNQKCRKRTRFKHAPRRVRIDKGGQRLNIQRPQEERRWQLLHRINEDEEGSSSQRWPD